MPKNFLEVIIQFGYGVYDFEISDFTEIPRCISLDRQNGTLKILIGTLGINFEECFKTKIVVETERVPIQHIGLNELLKNNKAVARPQELEDLRNLLRES